jgi:hypothetical protein
LIFFFIFPKNPKKKEKTKGKKTANALLNFIESLRPKWTGWGISEEEEGVIITMKTQGLSRVLPTTP